MDASGAPHGLMPMQAPGAFNRPISLQPFGQVCCRAVCGVAALANSTGYWLRTAPCSPSPSRAPGNTLVQLQKDFEQVLTPKGMAGVPSRAGPGVMGYGCGLAPGNSTIKSIAASAYAASANAVFIHIPPKQEAHGHLSHFPEPARWCAFSCAAMRTAALTAP